MIAYGGEKLLKPIYVETEIDARIEDVWEYSQTPELHQQWDVRFSTITYLPKKEDEPQAFTYTRTVGPLLKVEGWGKSVGQHEKSDGTKASSLHFGTDQWFSPIREGRGYWKYIPNDAGKVTFLTEYNYDTNMGKMGKFLDACLFRPIMGWGTALSFDVFKRWLEKKESPKSQYFRFFTTYALMILFSFIWIYQGLIPKIITIHPVEVEMVSNGLALTEAQGRQAVFVIGVCEILFGLIWLFYRKKKQIYICQLVLFVLLTIAAIIVGPEYMSHPFNPIVTNLALLALTIIGICISVDIPSARSCKRER